MPGISWLGQMPDKQPSRGQQDVAYIADAISKGTQAYFAAKQKRKELDLQTRELDIKERALKPYEKYIEMESERIQNEFTTNLAKIDIDKKKELVKTILDSVNMMEKAQADQFLSNPQVQALFNDVGVPVPTGAYGVRPKEGGSVFSEGGAVSRFFDRLGNKKTSNIKSITPFK